MGQQRSKSVACLVLSRPVQPKEPLSLELVVRVCHEYNGSASLGHLLFLTILMLGYAVFLRVDELQNRAKNKMTKMLR